jgi:hypothetical protein
VLSSNVLSLFQGEDADGARECEPFPASSAGIEKEGAVEDLGKRDMAVTEHHGLGLLIFYRSQNLGEHSVFFHRSMAKKDPSSGEEQHFFLW